MKNIRIFFTLIVAVLATALVQTPAKAQLTGPLDKGPVMSFDRIHLGVFHAGNVGLWLHEITLDKSGKYIDEKTIGPSRGDRSEIVYSKDAKMVGISDHGNLASYLTTLDRSGNQENDQEVSGYIEAFTPDGKVVWSRLGTNTPSKLQVSDLDWNHPQPYLVGYGPVRFSPDGSKVIFVPADNSEDKISLSSLADLSLKTDLTVKGSVVAAAWSPDGTKIAVVTSHEGSDLFWLETMKADGSNFTIVSDKLNWYQFDWSPDSKKLAYTQLFGTQSDVLISNADDTLSNTPKRLMSPYSSAPLFSADGSKIIFLSYRNGSELLYSMNADGSGQDYLRPGSGPQ